jgi:hypothetical protein
MSLKTRILKKEGVGGESQMGIMLSVYFKNQKKQISSECIFVDKKWQPMKCDNRDWRHILDSASH